MLLLIGKILSHRDNKFIYDQIDRLPGSLNLTLVPSSNILDNNNVTMLLSLRMQPTINFPFCKQKLTVIYDHPIIGHMEYISVEEAAEITGYSQQYIRRLLRQHRIQAVKKGYMWWVDLDSLKAYKQEMDSLGSEKFSPYREDE